MFSKTRIFYYDNEPSQLKIFDTSDLVIEVPNSSASYPFLSVGIPPEKHNWSTVPVNAYGLYCTFAELQSLVENNDSFCPEKIEITIGHTIPLAKYPSTANSTQLSFNNTIYSLICVNEDGYIGMASFVNDDEIAQIVRTFDGQSALDAKTRATLPKRHLWFRIPYTQLHVTDVDRPTDPAIDIPTTTTGQRATVLPDTFRLDYAQNIKQLIDSYIPELLQNNDNVFTLYPGENQFQKDFSNFTPEFATIDCSGPAFNETVWQLDTRFATLQNRDCTGREPNNVLSLPVLFQLKGNNNDTIGYISSESGDPKIQFDKMIDIWFNRPGDKCYSPNMPKIFIKGVPILDGSNNLVPHTFCCTVTWTLHVSTTPRSNMNTNRLQWRMTYPYLRAKYDQANQKIITDYIHQGNFAKKPWRHNIFKRTPMMRFNNLSTAQQTKDFTRTNLKNLFKNSAGNIEKSTVNSPDDISPSTFGYSLPFHAGWYEGHATYRTVPVNQ